MTFELLQTLIEMGSGLALGAMLSANSVKQKIRKMRESFNVEMDEKRSNFLAEVEAWRAAHDTANPAPTNAGPYRSLGVQGPPPNEVNEPLSLFPRNPEKCPGCDIDRCERLVVDGYLAPVSVFAVTSDEDDCDSACPDRSHHHVECRSCGMTWLLAPAVPVAVDAPRASRE